MAELTTLEEKLAEGLGLAQAAQGDPGTPPERRQGLLAEAGR
jgi:hypothetical protein